MKACIIQALKDERLTKIKSKERKYKEKALDYSDVAYMVIEYTSITEMTYNTLFIDKKESMYNLYMSVVGE